MRLVAQPASAFFNRVFARHVDRGCCKTQAFHVEGVFNLGRVGFVSEDEAGGCDSPSPPLGAPLLVHGACGLVGSVRATDAANEQSAHVHHPKAHRSEVVPALVRLHRRNESSVAEIGRGIGRGTVESCMPALCKVKLEATKRIVFYVKLFAVKHDSVIFF